MPISFWEGSVKFEGREQGENEKSPGLWVLF